MSTYQKAYKIIWEAVVELQKLSCTESKETMRWLDNLCVALIDAYFNTNP